MLLLGDMVQGLDYVASSQSEMEQRYSVSLGSAFIATSESLQRSPSLRLSPRRCGVGGFPVYEALTDSCSLR